MHLPESALRTSGFRRLRGMLRLGMDLGQRKVAKHKSQLGTERPLYVLDDRVRPATVGALVVTVFDQGHRGVFRAGRVVARSDWQCQLRSILTPAHARLPIG